MQLLIPYALVDDPGCAQALSSLQLPALELLLGRLTLTGVASGSPDSLTPPHERAQALSIGIPAADGMVPWAAWSVAHSGRDPGTTGWAWITPAHWEVARDSIRMRDPATLELPTDTSQALLQAMAPYFAQDGIELLFDAPGRWLARGQALATLPSASLDRVIDTDLGPWMPATAAMRRLQNEMQMLLYAHPLNDARSAQGLPTVNSFWISGSGALPAGTPITPGPAVADALRRPALQSDWPAWTRAWHEIDQGICQAAVAALERGGQCELVLCSQRHALHLAPARLGWRERMQRRLRKHRLKDYLHLS